MAHKAALADLTPPPIAIMAMAKLILQKLVTDQQFRKDLHELVSGQDGEADETPAGFRALFSRYGIWAGAPTDFNDSATYAVLFLVYEMLRRSAMAYGLDEKMSDSSSVFFPTVTPHDAPLSSVDHNFSDKNMFFGHMKLIEYGAAYASMLGLPDESLPAQSASISAGEYEPKAV